MKTFEEIAEYCRSVAAQGMFGFELEVVVPYLPFAHATEFLKPGTKEEDWNPQPLDEAAVILEMREYMANFGWPKAIDHRGLSAGRTIEKMGAWLWLLDKDELAAFAGDDKNYPMYGAPILFKICADMDFPIPDDEVARNMSLGLPCGDPDCAGCRPQDDEGNPIVAVGGTVKLS